MRKTLLITTLLTITLLAGCQAKKNRFHQPHPARSQLRRPTPTGQQLKKSPRGRFTDLVV